MGGLLSYLAGEGRSNEHTEPHLVNGDSATFTFFGDSELAPSTALAIAKHLDEPRTAFGVEVNGGHVWHASLSLRAEEGQLTDEHWATIAEEFVDRMGFTQVSGKAGCRWVAVRHGLSKAGNDHIHIAVNLVREDGLLDDGIRMRMSGPEVVDKIYTYNQGTALGASLEIALALREDVGLAHDEQIDSFVYSERADASMFYITHIRAIVQSVALNLATPQGVLLSPPEESGEGDGGLFKGILARYLAEVALRLPEDSKENIATRKIAARLVMQSADSLWSHRLEVDGLPVFAAEWTQDAKLPHNYGLGPSSISEAVGLVRIDERDLSVQLSGWMLLEAAARVAAAQP